MVSATAPKARGWEQTTVDAASSRRAAQAARQHTGLDARSQRRHSRLAQRHCGDDRVHQGVGIHACRQSGGGEGGGVEPGKAEGVGGGQWLRCPCVPPAASRPSVACNQQHRGQGRHARHAAPRRVKAPPHTHLRRRRRCSGRWRRPAARRWRRRCAWRAARARCPQSCRRSTGRERVGRVGREAEVG